MAYRIKAGIDNTKEQMMTNRGLLKKSMNMLLVLLAVYALLVTSCTSTPPIHSLEPFGIIGKDADVYAFVPVQGNEQLFQALCGAVFPQETLQQYLNRTRGIFAGFFLQNEQVVRICSYGSYPLLFADSLFPSSDGWEKRISAEKTGFSYYHAPTVDVALPVSSLACIALGPEPRYTEFFLQRLTEPQIPPVPPRFQSYTQTENPVNSIGIYIRSGSIVSDMFKRNFNINLPLSSIELYLTKKSDGSYSYEAVVTAENKRVVRLLSVFAAKIFKADISIEDSTLLLKNGIFSLQELLALLRPLQMTVRQ